MLRLTFSALCTLLLFLVSCDNAEEAPLRSQQFIDDSTLVAKYDPWFDTIFNRLPNCQTAETVKCPGGCFDGLELLNEKNPFLIFLPEELNRRITAKSFFRYRHVQGPVDMTGTFFNWEYGYNSPFELNKHAEEIRTVIGQQYFCVFIVDTAEYVMPLLDTSAREYFPGKIAGYAVMVDFAEGKSVCAFRVKAESSKEVTYKTIMPDDPKMSAAIESGPFTSIQVDLWLNLAAEIKKKLLDSQTAVRNNPAIIIHDPIY